LKRAIIPFSCPPRTNVRLRLALRLLGETPTRDENRVSMSRSSALGGELSILNRIEVGWGPRPPEIEAEVTSKRSADARRTSVQGSKARSNLTRGQGEAQRVRVRADGHQGVSLGTPDLRSALWFDGGSRGGRKYPRNLPRHLARVRWSAGSRPGGAPY
jgi:hypothetical protein